jgi:hypothetical protein
LFADCYPGLPDGIHISKPKILFYILRGLGLENVVISCGHLVYFTTIWYVFVAIWYFFPVLVFCTKKNLASLRSTYLEYSGVLSSETVQYFVLATYKDAPKYSLILSYDQAAW